MNKLQLPAALALLCAAGSALAEGECNSGFRPLKTDEQAMFQSLAAAARLLPPAPAGWEAAEPQLEQAPEQVCKDYDARPEPLWIGLSAAYANHPGEEEMSRRMALLEALRNDPKTSAARDKIAARQQQIIEQMGAAGSDMAKISKLGEENSKLLKQSEDLDRPYRDKQSELFYQDMKAQISLSFNPRDESCAGERRALTVAGASAWLCQIGWNQNGRRDDQTEGEGMFNSRLVVLFGNWKTVKEEESLRFTASFDRQKKPAVIQTLRLAIDADAKRVEALLSAINTGAFKALTRK